MTDQEAEVNPGAKGRGQLVRLGQADLGHDLEVGHILKTDLGQEVVVEVRWKGGKEF